MKTSNTASKDNARNSVTESPGFTEGRARTERRIASGNRRSGAIEAIKAVPQAGKPKSSAAPAKKKTKKS
ncbi:MAG: hypothetical protein M3Y69_08220 [Verrucomicrobiota bacterium]|nr:hypothetical protein [Verrucomicrobiota bacterium]